MSFNGFASNSKKDGGGLVWKSQLFTASGTWTKPVKFAGTDVLLTGIGGGGSGTSAISAASIQSGGDGGEYVIDYAVDVSALSTVAITIGAGGALANGGGADTAGNNGGTTSFGALMSVSGGQGGQLSYSAQLSGNTGGTFGGREDNTWATSDGRDNPSKYGGRGGLAALSNAGGGGGGLVLDDSGTGGSAANTSSGGGFGYGAGGGHSTSSNVTNSGAGADGALLVTWQETI